MALYKLFPRHKAIQQKTHEDPVSYKNAAFNTDHVRVLLFQECDFRGRKLLFDHDVTEKVPMDKAEQDKKFIEVTNNIGYFISKQKSDYHQLSEMVFGSVAMSFQGSYFKIHHLNSPTKLMFTHVFQSPHGRRQRTSTSSQPSRVSTPSSFEHSTKLDDSGGSSTFSTSDRLSDRSTASDTILVCRRLQSGPLDVLRISSCVSRNSLAVDSGFADHSFSSFSTGPVTFSTWESLFTREEHSFTSCYAFKRLMRSSTRSLQQSSTSLPSSSGEVLPKHRHRVSKLGLSIIIEIPAESKEFLIQFLMEHIALLDALIWRTRQSIEQAYHHPAIFVSSMMDIAQSTACGLVNLLNAPRILINLWHCLSTDCDNRISIRALVPENGPIALCRSGKIHESLWSGERNSNKTRLVSSFNGCYTGKSERTEGFHFSFVNFFKTDSEKNGRKGLGGEGFIGDKFLKEFCELVEIYDVKDTNFFISTLLTAVLTHHLGWVSTVFPTDKETISAKVPYNALWGQLVDMYGAVGYPVKIAQTVITGTNKNRVITKILNSLTYFIRFNNVERKRVERISVEKENRYAEMIFTQNNCIPKEYYKSYEDHLKEMLSDDNDKLKSSSSHAKNKRAPHEKSLKFQKTGKGLTRVKTHGDLAELVNGNRALRKLSVIDVNDTENKTDEKKDYCDMNKASVETTCEKNNVIFVLGDNDKLVGLKKDEAQTEGLTVGSGARRKVSSAKRPSALNLSKPIAEPPKRIDTKVSDLSRCPKSRSSLESLCLEENDLKVVPYKPSESKTFVRAQSEPPENKKLTSPRYQYSQVKFNLQQYPQVVKNYMKSKNIELEGFSLDEKVFDKFATVQYNISLDFSGYGSDSEQVEGLQTPSNASEMEFTSDMCTDAREEEKSTEIFENGGKLMKIVNIPMPKTTVTESQEQSVPYSSTVIKGLVDQYIPDMVLQGTTSPQAQWESRLKKNLARQTQHSLLDQAVEEALAIVASTDTWEVQLMSSHTYVIDKGSSGVRIGMSQLVANMLETLLHMWKAHIPAQHCLRHIEQKLQELCLRSRALAQLLLASEFCSIELLTSALKVEVNDVPLLMAVASTHTPQVTQKYGLSFQ